MKKGLIALVAVMGIVASTALIVNTSNAFGLGKGMESGQPTVEDITTRLQEQGLSDEAIQERLTEHEQQMKTRTETFAELMGIDSATLEQELDTSTMPELLDKYEVSHVALHDAMQGLKDEFPGQMHGQRFGQ